MSKDFFIFRHAKDTAEYLSVLYNSLRNDRNFKDFAQQVEIQSNKGDTFPLWTNLHFMFIFDICQCHKLLEIPFNTENGNVGAALVFYSQAIGCEISGYKHFSTLITDPDVLDRFLNLADSLKGMTLVDHDRPALLHLLAEHYTSYLKEYAYILKVYGNYLCKIEGISKDDPRHRKWDSIISYHYDR